MDIGKPYSCSRCGGRLKYRGLGEYECEKCKNIELDHYGVVRNYVDAHPGANITTVSEETGISRKEIARMVDEDKFQIAGYKRS